MKVKTEALSKSQDNRNHHRSGYPETSTPRRTPQRFIPHKGKLPLRSRTSHEWSKPQTSKRDIRAAVDMTRREVSPRELFFFQPWIVVHPLPHNGFRYCFTLSPKCFSSFAHATCALSVFSRYLALAEVYLPFALHSQAVLLRKFQGVVSRSGQKTGLSPSRALLSRKTFPAYGNTRNFILHNSDVIRFGLGFSLFARRY